MSSTSIYRTPEREAEIHAMYDQQLTRRGLPHESRMVNTRFGPHTRAVPIPALTMLYLPLSLALYSATQGEI